MSPGHLSCHHWKIIHFIQLYLPKICWRDWTLLTVVAQMVKNLAAMWETWIWSLGWEDPLQEGVATHPSILAQYSCPSPWTEEPGGPQIGHVLQRVGYNWATKHTHTESVQFNSVAQSCLTLFTPWTAAWQAFLSIAHSGVYSNSCPLSQWCHPTISSSVIPFSSCLQSFPASGSFQMSQFFASGGQSIGASASASVLSMNVQDWFPLGWTGWISLQSKGLSRVFSITIVQKHQFFGAQLSL